MVHICHTGVWTEAQLSHLLHSGLACEPCHWGLVTVCARGRSIVRVARVTTSPTAVVQALLTPERAGVQGRGPEGSLPDHVCVSWLRVLR